MTEFTTDEAMVNHVVENVFKPMREAMRRPLTQREMESMVKIRLMPPANMAGMYREMHAELFAVKVAGKRAATFHARIDEGVLIFLSLVANSPAELALYLNFAVWCAREMRVTEINFSYFATSVCPLGLLKAEDTTALLGASKFRINGFESNALDSAALCNFLNSPKGEAS